MDKIKVGFIGTGGIAGAHMGNLAQFDDVEFAAMCDISEDRATSRTQEYGGTAYTDYKEMFDREDLDAVYICTPPFLTVSRSGSLAKTASRCLSKNRLQLIWSKPSLSTSMLNVTILLPVWVTTGGTVETLRMLRRSSIKNHRSWVLWVIG